MICGMLWLNSCLQGIHIVGVHGHDVAVGMGIKIFDRQRFHPVEQIVS